MGIVVCGRDFGTVNRESVLCFFVVLLNYHNTYSLQYSLLISNPKPATLDFTNQHSQLLTTNWKSPLLLYQVYTHLHTDPLI